MRVWHTVAEWTAHRRSIHEKTIGFVPTMGALHSGHASLVERCRRENDITAVSIFVNPAQFNDPKDLERYPRMLESDLALLEKLGTDEVFVPDKSELYPHGYRFRIEAESLTNVMEGVRRPGFFQGVMTIVLKLLNLVRADRAYFGDKDYQQLKIITEMAAEFFTGTEIVGCPIVRESSGLAESSRNALLSPAARNQAAALFRALTTTASPSQTRALLEAEGLTVEYVEEHWGRRFGAVSIEGIRLIDNAVISGVIMLLCLDVGNSQIFGGVYEGEELLTTFRRTSSVRASSDEFGTFFRAILKENDIDPKKVDMAALCSVVPDAIHSLRSCFHKYFRFEPFLLQPGVKTGLKIRYRNPLEVGADKIANAIGAMTRFPGRNLLIVDFGTATTLCAVTKDKEYLGGIITPGMQISMAALESRTARLPAVEIVRPLGILGRSTVESIQSGLYYGTLATVKSLAACVTEAHFGKEHPLLVGTGGFARLFENENLLDAFVPELPLIGLRRAVELSQMETKR